MSQADQLLASVFQKLNMQDKTDLQKYTAIDQIVAELHIINQSGKISLGTTGTISERLCALALPDEWMVDNVVRSFGKNWKWIGDKLLPGHPYDIAVSIKSFKAKERLLASGTGSLLTPTIGWGLFDDPKEWSRDRVSSYLYRGFIAIYMPITTLKLISSDACEVKNINGNPLLRELALFPHDLITARSKIHQNRLDVRRI